MPDNHEQDGEWPEDAAPSKSARKREMHALQAMGESLVQLSDKQLQQIAIEDEALLEAILECRRISSNSARKRHLQYVGKLMRKVDTTAIQAALDTLHHAHQASTDAFHELEALRDAMLEAGPPGVELALVKFPDADRQHLRQLLRQHQREVSKQQAPAASRKLFRYLRELHTA